jgi:hypothetical protein
VVKFNGMRWLREIGYVVVDRFEEDVFMVHKG